MSPIFFKKVHKIFLFPKNLYYIYNIKQKRNFKYKIKTCLLA
jgi:hypothetical protein